MRYVLTTVLMLGATAAPAVDVEAIRQCAAVKNAQVRLACYDAAAKAGKPKPDPAQARPRPQLSQPDRSGK